MIFQTKNGEATVVHGTSGSRPFLGGKHYFDVALVRRSIALMLKQQGIPAEKAAEVLCISRRSYFSMIKPTPRPLGVVFGSGEWTPADQDQDPATCNRCGGDGGSIKSGSRLYCAACHRTGFEKRLEKERIDDVFQEAMAAECESQARKAEMANRRKKRKK